MPPPAGEPEAIAVDWSGARHPSGRIWMATARAGELCDLRPAATRGEVVDELVERGRSATGPLAVGLDFAFSLPVWFVRQHDLSSVRELWRLVAAEGERWLADCQPPFWGRPGRKRPPIEAPFRRTELECEPVAGIRPKSVFQIGGAGAVGTGSLRGMPHLLRLSDAGFAIWPFEETTDRTVFEVYPRLCTGPVRKSVPAARRQALEPFVADGAIDAAMAVAAASTEDAFDAAITAVVMSRQRPEISGLPAARDDVELLEGRIAPLRAAP